MNENERSRCAQIDVNKPEHKTNGNIDVSSHHWFDIAQESHNLNLSGSV